MAFQQSYPRRWVEGSTTNHHVQLAVQSIHSRAITDPLPAHHHQQILILPFLQGTFHPRNQAWPKPNLYASPMV